MSMKVERTKLSFVIVYQWMDNLVYASHRSIGINQFGVWVSSVSHVLHLFLRAPFTYFPTAFEWIQSKVLPLLLTLVKEDLYLLHIYVITDAPKFDFYLTIPWFNAWKFSTHAAPPWAWCGFWFWSQTLFLTKEQTRCFWAKSKQVDIRSMRCKR